MKIARKYNIKQKRGNTADLKGYKIYTSEHPYGIGIHRSQKVNNKEGRPLDNNKGYWSLVLY